MDDSETQRFLAQEAAKFRATWTLIKKPDPRWFLAQQAALGLKTTGLLPDEMPTAIVGGQLAMFVEVLDDCMRDLPRRFFLYRWANAFETDSDIFHLLEKGDRRKPRLHVA
jgi:hypothetical protein